MLRKFLSPVLAASILALGVTAAANPAEAQYYRRGYYGYGHGYGRGPGPGAIVGGALLGLGVGALLAAPYYRPPVVYAPPPPAYYPPPAYAYAPPAYYPYYRPY